MGKRGILITNLSAYRNVSFHNLPSWLWVSYPSQFWCYVFKKNAKWLIIFTKIISLIILKFLYYVQWEVQLFFVFSENMHINWIQRNSLENSNYICMLLFHPLLGYYYPYVGKYWMTMFLFFFFLLRYIKVFHYVAAKF